MLPATDSMRMVGHGEIGIGLGWLIHVIVLWAKAAKIASLVASLARCIQRSVTGAQPVHDPTDCLSLNGRGDTCLLLVDSRR